MNTNEAQPRLRADEGALIGYNTITEEPEYDEHTHPHADLPWQKSPPDPTGTVPQEGDLSPDGKSTYTNGKWVVNEQETVAEGTIRVIDGITKVFTNGQWVDQTPYEERSDIRRQEEVERLKRLRDDPTVDSMPKGEVATTALPDYDAMAVDYTKRIQELQGYTVGNVQYTYDKLKGQIVQTDPDGKQTFHGTPEKFAEEKGVNLEGYTTAPEGTISDAAEQVTGPDDFEAGTATAVGVGAAQGTGQQGQQQPTVTAGEYTAEDAADLAATTAAQGEVSKTAEATTAELTERAEAAERDTTQEDEAQAEKIAFERDLKSVIDPVTGAKTFVTTTPDAEKKQRKDLTGKAPTDEIAAVIDDLAGYDAALRRFVKGEAATRSAEVMIAELGELPPIITAALVEDPASVTAQLDENTVEVQAAIAALPTEALMSVQIEGLLAGMDEGRTPLWARPAVAHVEQMMAQRGLSVSTVGRDALFNAIIQSALPIAQNNAQALQQRAAQNLSNEQQANLAESTQDMQRRMANLANRQTSESQSAQMAQQMKVMQSQFRQDTGMLTAQQQQQTRTQHLQNRQQAAVLEYQTKEALNAQNLGNEQQMEMANLQVEAERAGADQSAVNQERLAEFQVAADFMAKNAGFTQQMKLANLSNEQQMSLANLSSLNQAASERLTAEQQTEFANLNKTLETNKLQAQIASQMKLAQLNVDQQRAIQNAATVANIDMSKFNAGQQTELANSKFMQTMVMTDFNARQTAAMQNATAMVQMDIQAADLITRSSIENAKNFLQMDMANLNANQQGVILDQQMSQQRLLSDQSAANAAEQFNATSQNQINQFNTSMAQNMSQFNATQVQTMSQFNASEANRAAALTAQNETDINKFNKQIEVQVKEFNAQLEQQRETWNVAATQAIEQSNVEWRRRANTIDTAAQNATNAQNTQNSFSISQTAQSQLWQEIKDQVQKEFSREVTKDERVMSLINVALSSESFMTKKAFRSQRTELFKLLNKLTGSTF